MKIVNFRVSDADHALMRAIAESSGVSLSAYIRQHFKTRAIAEGLVPNPLDTLRPQTPGLAEPPTPARKPIPTTGWRAELVAMADKGASVADIAAAYGVSTELVKSQLKAARDDAQYRADAAAQAQQPQPSEPVYAPADPDNPTEEEQAAHAAAARRKLEAMGFSL